MWTSQLSPPSTPRGATLATLSKLAAVIIFNTAKSTPTCAILSPPSRPKVYYAKERAATELELKRLTNLYFAQKERRKRARKEGEHLWQAQGQVVMNETKRRRRRRGRVVVGAEEAQGVSDDCSETLGDVCERGETPAMCVCAKAKPPLHLSAPSF